MPAPLCAGCVLSCTMGTVPMPFIALPIPGVPIVDGLPTATILDIAPFLNIPSFIMCRSPANPAVAAIIAASLGTVTEGPCIPVPVIPWEPPSVATLSNGIPLATVESMCVCAWLGEISVEVPIEGPMMTE